MKTVIVRKMDGGFMGFVFWAYKLFTGISNLRGYTTFWHTIYLDERYWYDEKLLAHELTHVKQIDDLGLLKFTYKYVKELIKNGYRNNSFEVEARAADMLVIGKQYNIEFKE